MNVLQIAIAVVVGLIYMGMGIAAVFFNFTPYPVLNLVFCVICIAYGGFRIYRGWMATKHESSL